MWKMDLNFAMYMEGVFEMYYMVFTDCGLVIVGGDASVAVETAKQLVLERRAQAAVA